MTQRIDDELTAAARKRPDQSAQGLPRPDLQQSVARLFQQCPRAFGEAHRLPQVASPVSRVCGLVRFDPSPRHVGDVAKSRGAQAHLLNLIDEGRYDRFHHPRMKGVRREQAASADILLREALLKFFYRITRT